MARADGKKPDQEASLSQNCHSFVIYALFLSEIAGFRAE